MARKKHHVEHPDERWLLTYADMITLLMALFMVMYAMSLVDKTKFQELRIVFKETFSSAVFSGGKSVLEAGAASSHETAAQSELTGPDTPFQEASQASATQGAAAPTTRRSTRTRNAGC